MTPDNNIVRLSVPRNAVTQARGSVSGHDGVHGAAPSGPVRRTGILRLLARLMAAPRMPRQLFPRIVFPALPVVRPLTFRVLLPVRALLPVLAMLLVAACAGPLPDSNPRSGVGFGTIEDYAARNAAPVPSPQQITVLPPSAPQTVAGQTGLQGDAALASDVAAALAATGPGTATAAQPQPAPLQPAPLQPAPLQPAPLQPAPLQPVTLQPTASAPAPQPRVQPATLPARSETGRPNIVAYAIDTTNTPGVQIYDRSRLFGNADRACARFSSPDLAQEAFLAAGGPKRDGKDLDPDGDGFACGWDPLPFRTVRP